MKIHDAEDVQYLLRTTGRKLSPNQRLVVLLYASAEQNPDGTVMTRATELAETAGMTPPVFSRTRKELCEAGWLEETGKFGRVSLYRLNRAMFTDRGAAGRHLHAVRTG
ncbi:helix-turn-helix domain-containing protein [Streptomyces sp. MJP52]|jgi:DNA-binding IclR family transcriptional regulator|uniref:helix-turn-helix domain-containing protein n=1 Tax=Streptomyces sp. MJP52 TaxID=2940555 RepID=UPI0024736638|nr:helix-turn-helix domain-containing protein [Streptomyces sp. MJP52]MDH6229124.1 DNA-binding IclR family transcriptional regulator [Streptomyces sp. MJP52]